VLQPLLLGVRISEQKYQGTFEGEGEVRRSSKSQLWETKIDWLFGTVDPCVLYIIIITTNIRTNTSIANHLTGEGMRMEMVSDGDGDGENGGCRVWVHMCARSQCDI
jgi:hypothetical protein